MLGSPQTPLCNHRPVTAREKYIYIYFEPFRNTKKCLEIPKIKRIDKSKVTSPLMNQGCHAFFTGSFIVFIVFLVEVTGTLAWMSPLHFIQ